MPILSNPTKLYTRYIQVKITLAEGTFTVNGQDTGDNQVIINKPSRDPNFQYLTVHASITKQLSQNNPNQATIVVFGLDKGLISQLSTLGYWLDFNFNRIELYAGYDPNVLNMVFAGCIIKAHADYSDPSRPMTFECNNTYVTQLDNPAPTNPQGTVQVPQLFKSIADAMGYGFLNNGVAGQVDNPILSGSYPDQVKNLAKQVNVMYSLDGNMLSVAPNGVGLNPNVLEIDSTSGLIGYPGIDNWGIRFKMRFNPQLILGQYVNVTSIVPKASGLWYVYSVESEINNRHEPWFSELKVSPNANINQVGNTDGSQ